MYYNRETIQQIFDLQPFSPLDIVSTAGRHYPVRHPENVLLAEPLMVIMVDATKGLYASIPYAHIAAIEHVEGTGK